MQKRVRLGGLPEEIIDAYREGRINADTATALKLSQLTNNTVFSKSCAIPLLVSVRVA